MQCSWLAFLRLADELEGLYSKSKKLLWKRRYNKIGKILGGVPEPNREPASSTWRWKIGFC